MSGRADSVTKSAVMCPSGGVLSTQHFYLAILFPRSPQIWRNQSGPKMLFLLFAAAVLGWLVLCFLVFYSADAVSLSVCLSVSCCLLALLSCFVCIFMFSFSFWSRSVVFCCVDLAICPSLSIVCLFCCPLCARLRETGICRGGAGRGKARAERGRRSPHEACHPPAN